MLASANVLIAQNVPYVGCPSNGQVGPLSAPHGSSPAIRLSPKAAAQLAWYKSENAPGVLAPRGWHCFGTYGSNGGTLYVSPIPLKGSTIFSDGWRGFDGPAIQISISVGDTSGRFIVARQIARLFPEHMDFTRDVISESTESASDFPVGPFTHDKLTYKTKTLAEFETPPQTQGMGTQSKLQPNSSPITGFVFLSLKSNDDPYSISLEVRLPADLTWLAPEVRSGSEAAAAK